MNQDDTSSTATSQGAEDRAADSVVSSEDLSVVDPLGDGDRLSADQAKKNYAKVGSARPTTLLYTYGPGAVIDLPHFTIMPAGLDDWEHIWRRRDSAPVTVHAPRLLETVQLMLGHQVGELRRFPWQPTRPGRRREGDDLGVPARVFPQWLRCTGCDLLAPVGRFVDGYSNTHPFRPDQAVFEHRNCPGRVRRRSGSRSTGSVGQKQRMRRSPCVPARYLLACPIGHLDEFPYDWWVHEGAHCTKAPNPELEMRDTSLRGATAIISCRACGSTRPMAQAQGEEGRSRLPRCRGRHPHLGGFDPEGCQAEPRVMLVGASNLWFAATQSIIDMPRLDPAARERDQVAVLRRTLGEDRETVGDNLDLVRMLLKRGDAEAARLAWLPDSELTHLLELLSRPTETEDERLRRREQWDPVDLLVPEWNYLEEEPLGERHEDPDSRLVVSPRSLGQVPRGISRVLAVDRLRKVNAILGFTRIDDFDRVDDTVARLVPLVRGGRPAWVPATEDLGEGIFLQLDEEAVAAWERRVLASPLWFAHRQAHRRNVERRFSETARAIQPDERFVPPRYWLLHTFAHALIRQMAMSSGYGAASISERVYAWTATDSRPAAAGVLLTTTASDSDGTLGGLVSLSEPERLSEVVSAALMGMMRCSSDPVCARRVPQDPEDFLHGAACHCCTMVSETSCERANRFLDRRFVVPLPGEHSVGGKAQRSAELAFFEDVRRV
ncbi:DUF1998 domain-containing protein [Actinomyces howellii]|uniref:Domain of uncharacterized function (DUF1998) n=1 Tax=Actinomyces howellii TaxID=52771 RepID=A0A3S4V4U8_9ACTO|nr:DUF1998 domain-containing protein [Actinomyces howellii]VEG28347.1 Domain of uncharacterised function (DUF1998) [Actinomyces howellii]